MIPQSGTYLLQSRSDWQVYQILQRQPVKECHSLHYLQMATEKLGKAFLIAGGNAPASVYTSHKAFVRFLQVVAYNSDLQKQLRMTRQQLRAYIRTLLPIADEIERLAPALAHGGPNAEYPWEAPAGTIQTPATYQFTLSSQLRTPKGIKLLTLITVIFENSEKFMS
jgi:hypothetical protein